MAIQVTSVPTTGAIATRPRKEGLYDTEVYDTVAANNANPTTWFRNATAFQNTVTTVGNSGTKTFLKDTNIQGQGGLLPRSWHFYWYGMHLKTQAGEQSLQSDANAALIDELRQWRECSAFEFKFGTTPYLGIPVDEIPDQVGPGPAISTTTVAATLFQSYTWGAAVKNNTYSVTIAGKPQELTELETFTVDITQTPSLTFSVEWLAQVYLEGVVLKGITG